MNAASFVYIYGLCLRTGSVGTTYFAEHVLRWNHIEDHITRYALENGEWHRHKGEWLNAYYADLEKAVLGFVNRELLAFLDGFEKAQMQFYNDTRRPYLLITGAGEDHFIETENGGVVINDSYAYVQHYPTSASLFDLAHYVNCKECE